MLSAREHSAKELFDKLVQKGFEVDEVSDALVDLQNDGLQSDTRFAESFVRSWVGKGRGEVRIRMDLQQHEVGSDIIEHAMHIEPIDWLRQITIVWEKKFNQAPSSLSEKAKQVRFLQQRGFPADLIYQVIPE